MPTALDKSQSDVLAALRLFLLTILAPGVEVVQGMDNRVSMPLGDFVAMTPGSMKSLNVPTTSYDADSQTQVFQSKKQFSVQLDCYGATSGAMATTISTLLRTAYAYDMLDPVVAPLFASEPTQMPLVNGEQQYEERWMLSAELQYNPSITVPQDFAESLSVGIINVDVAYPPGA